MMPNDPSSATAAGERRGSAGATSESPATLNRKARRRTRSRRMSEFAAVIWFGSEHADVMACHPKFKLLQTLLEDFLEVLKELLVLRVSCILFYPSFPSNPN